MCIDGDAQAVITAEQIAAASREKEVALVLAAQEAEQRAIGVKVEAEAEREAAESKAEAIRTLARANRENYEVEAAGKQAINSAINTLSNAQLELQAKLALIQALPKIIDDFGLSVRSLNSLKNSNIRTLADLVQYPEEDLLKVKNVGEKALSEIADLLRREGLNFGMAFEEAEGDYRIAKAGIPPTAQASDDMVEEG